MSRSYHITKREAARRFVHEGDVEALQTYAEKQTLKDVVKVFRGVYEVIHPSDKPQNKLSGSMAHRVMKVMTIDNAEKANRVVAERAG